MFELNSIGQVPPQDVKTHYNSRTNKMKETAINSILNYKPGKTNKTDKTTDDGIIANKDGTFSHTRYDSEGYPGETRVIDANGKLVSHSYFLYCDNKDRRSEIKCIYNDGGQVVKRVLTNTDKNNVVYRQVTDWNPDDKKLVICDYDENGELVERWEGSSDGLPDSWKIDDYCIEEGVVEVTYKCDDK